MRSSTKAGATDAYVVATVAGLKALAEPLRLRVLLELAEGPRTVKEIAATLGIAQTRLYYHVKILEEAGPGGASSRGSKSAPSRPSPRM